MKRHAIQWPHVILSGMVVALWLVGFVCMYRAQEAETERVKILMRIILNQTEARR